MISKIALRYLISVVIATLIAGALISMDLKALGVNVIKTSESTQPPIGKVIFKKFLKTILYCNVPIFILGLLEPL